MKLLVKKIVFIIHFVSILTAVKGTVLLQVVDAKTKIGIPYYNVILNDNLLLISDSLGIANIDDSIIGKRILISCLGYIDSSIIISSNINLVELQNSTTQLQEVEIISSACEVKKQIVGCLSENLNGSYYFRKGAIVGLHVNARRVDFRKGNVVLLEKVSFFITDEGVSNSNFRIRVLAFDSTNTPSIDMLNDNVIANSGNRKGWVDVDVSKYNIRVPENGLIIGMEWINDTQVLSYQKSFGGIVENYEGQVLGGTWKTKDAKTWIKTSAGWNIDSGMKTIKFVKTLNAMIRANVLVVNRK